MYKNVVSTYQYNVIETIIGSIGFLMTFTDISKTWFLHLRHLLGKDSASVSLQILLKSNSRLTEAVLDINQRNCRSTIIFFILKIQ